MKQLIPIYEFQYEKVAAGQHKFPFRIATPDTLPGAFNYVQGTTTAQIRYSVTAKMQSSHFQVRRAKMPIAVSGRMTEPIVSLQATATVYMCSWWCFRSAPVRVNVQINKSAYVPGELAYVTAEIDNSFSGLDVIGLKGTLYRTIRLRNKSGVYRVLKEIINNGSVNRRVPAGQVALGAHALHLALAVPGSPEISPSLREHHIECLYTITVEAVLDSQNRHCAQPVRVTRTVTVYEVQMPIGMPLLPAAGWNPAVLPLVHTLSSSAYQYA